VLRSIKTTLSRIIPSPAQLFHAKRQDLTAGKSILKIVLERCRCPSTLDYKSLSCRLSPEAEKFAAPVRSTRPSIW
jgi:hypothetical protein